MGRSASRTTTSWACPSSSETSATRARSASPSVRVSPSRWSTTARTGRVRPYVSVRVLGEVDQEGRHRDRARQRGHRARQRRGDTRSRPARARPGLLVQVRAPADIAPRIAGIRVQEPWAGRRGAARPHLDDDEIVCRCERVTASELRGLIRAGIRDMNHLKAVTRCGMGACGGKTCPSLIKRIFREEGIPTDRSRTSRGARCSSRCRSAPSRECRPTKCLHDAPVGMRPPLTKEACDEHRTFTTSSSSVPAAWGCRRRSSSPSRA